MTNKITAKDYDGNKYKTVKIGSQIWMAENLKTTRYSNGDPILTTASYYNDDYELKGRSEREWAIIGHGDGGYAMYPYDNDEYSMKTCKGFCKKIYGNLYNWYAVNDERGISPKGFHVPTDEEWIELEMYLGMSYEDAHKLGNRRGTKLGKQLLSTKCPWSSEDFKNDPAFGSSGFHALLGGHRDNWGSYFYMGFQGSFWSSSGDEDSFYARCRILQHSNFDRELEKKGNGYSVRCLKDD
jgi:uncharacterized protein (TIGR02145 family)